MSGKLTPSKPFLLLLYGYPGSGKTLFARQLADELDNTVHLNADKLEHDLSQEISGESQLVVAISSKLSRSIWLKNISVAVSA